jgi:signal transduction histidine kinase
LIGNAAKFTAKGRISVRLFRADEERWGFYVADTGPGIPPEAQAFVFESFRQVEGVTTREHGGIGLGLAIVKSLLGLMGGDIKLDSEVGRGTTFTVTLPFEPPKEKS